MVQQNDRNPFPTRTRKRSNIPFIIFVAIIILGGIGLYYYLQNKSAPPLPKTPGIVEDQRAPQKNWPTQDQSSQLQGIVGDQGQRPLPQDAPSTAPEETLDDQAATAEPPAGSPQDAGPVELNGIGSAADKNSAEHSQQLVDKMNTFYLHLDQQPYIEDLALQEPSRIYFSKLLQKLADNPPTVIRETDNLYTLLRNTAHFFRILGKKNIVISKKILATENNYFEQNANTLYRLTAYPEVLKKEFNLSIEPKVITDYAAFFLNTMGGRLYLFRRDSTTRMVVTFYAIKAIDRANKAGDSGHGIDLRPAIPALIEEMENGGRLLHFREHYLDALYDLQEKYN